MIQINRDTVEYFEKNKKARIGLYFFAIFGPLFIGYMLFWPKILLQRHHQATIAVVEQFTYYYKSGNQATCTYKVNGIAYRIHIPIDNYEKTYGCMVQWNSRFTIIYCPEDPSINEPVYDIGLILPDGQRCGNVLF